MGGLVYWSAKHPWHLGTLCLAFHTSEQQKQPPSSEKQRRECGEEKMLPSECTAERLRLVEGEGAQTDVWLMYRDQREKVFVHPLFMCLINETLGFGNNSINPLC